MPKPHWRVAPNSNGAPSIFARMEDDPFVVMGQRCSIGNRGQQGWCDLICSWMNAHMRLGHTENHPQHCDPLLMVKLASEKERVTDLYKELMQVKAERDQLRLRLQNIRSAAIY